LVTVATTLITAAALAVPVGGDDGPRFLIAVPSGWSSSAEAFDANDFRYVYTSMSNATGSPRVVARVEVIEYTSPLDSLHVLGKQFLTHYTPEAFEEQLEPGTVYLDVGVVHGGPPSIGPDIYVRERGPEARIGEFVVERPAAWDTELSTGYRVSFGKWGKGWEVLIAARKPFTDADLASAFHVVGSLRFPGVPVVIKDQALEIATDELPAHMRVQDDWLDGCALYFHYDTVTEPLGNGAFRVEFRVLDGTQARSVVRRCAYRVGRGGTIERLDCPEE
ncbi:MAG: hypothetical protein K8E66_14745, partial [Phycisphaerales bacterium]|nr:hypothetical protein [Phycisphaerales bacterium]